MRRTSVLLDPAILTELEELARRQARPTAHLIREAMEQYVTGHRGEASVPLPSFVGIGHGPGGVASHDEEILAAELPASLTAEQSDGKPSRRGR